MVTRPRSRLLAVMTAVAVLFVGLAIFSPLHKHHLRNHSTKCSLNNLEGCITDEHTAGPELPQLAFVDEIPHQHVESSVSKGTRSRLPARSPPSFS